MCEVQVEHTLSELIIPKPLLGTYSQVKRRWLRITLQALQDGTWRRVLADMEYLSLAESQEDLLLEFTSRYSGPGDFWQLFHVHNLLRTGCDRLFGVLDPGQKSQAAICSLNWQGIKYPWFILSALCSQQSSLPALEEERARFACRVLDVLIEWWDCFCQLDERFREGYSRGWPGWSSYMMGMFRDLGVHKEQYTRINFVSPEEAGRLMRQWLKQWGNLSS